jgi:hypothetical protein
MASDLNLDERSACRIVPVGKRRDGRTRYWCLEHKSDATAKYGVRAEQCRYANASPISTADSLTLDVAAYRGGVALWGAVPPIYDTTKQPTERGVHVHARCTDDGPKEIDATYRSVALLGWSGDRAENEIVISELDAIYYMASSVFGFQTKYVECNLCAYPHLDKDWFSVHAHKRHLCAGCGREFRDNEAAIGNPIAQAREKFIAPPQSMKPASMVLDVKQRDYPGGIQMWGSNPAILWTAARSEDEGIHIHAFSADAQILIDDTFASVCIDGVDFDPTAVPNMYGAGCPSPHFRSGGRDSLSSVPGSPFRPRSQCIYSA